MDHIYPIIKGFENNIDPKIIANPYNLRILKGQLNRKKYTNEEITKEELFFRYNKFKQGDDFKWQDK